MKKNTKYNGFEMIIGKKCYYNIRRRSFFSKQGKSIKKGEGKRERKGRRERAGEG
jgi:hypothetical protein